MALTPGTVWEVRDTGHTDNPGAFNPLGSSPGIDRSQQDAPHVLMDGTTVRFTTAGASATITLVGHTVSADDNRNLVRLTAGTNVTVGIYEIISVNVGANTWTLDRAATTGATANGAGRMGGAVATPGRVGATMSNDDTMWIKYSASAYMVDNATANTANSKIRGVTSGRVKIYGYDVVRGDRTGNRPTIRAGANSQTLFDFNNNQIEIKNFVLDGNRATYTNAIGVGMGSGTYGRIQECHFINFGSMALNGSNASPVYIRLCTFTNNQQVMGSIWTEVSDCEFYANTGSYLCPVSGGTFHRCLFYDNTATISMIRGSVGVSACTIRVVECSFYSNVGSSIQVAAVAHLIYAENCHTENCGSWAYDGGTSGTSVSDGMLNLLNCSGYGNTTGHHRNTRENVGFKVLTASAFSNPGVSDLSLNSNTNGGEELKGAGYIPTWVRGLTPNSNANDIGAWQGAPTAVTVGWPTSGMRIPWQQ